MPPKVAQKKTNRKEDILRTLAFMLEGKPGERITTSKLASQVGFSEAALYRHFPSKARMFEGLIDFIDETIFTQINVIKATEKQAFIRIEHLLYFLLAFAQQNPGITRLLTGDALLGENKRLQTRIEHIFSKLGLQIKQILREKPIQDGGKLLIDEAIISNLLLAYVEGRMNQFVRSQFKQKPTKDFKEQWILLHNVLINTTTEL
ncbi:MAG: nucleoid occlusion factor SlmA [Psychromonas sp.]|nr:nucleoid occlusion factor SlmA [Psychromonas sp.]